MNVKIIFMDFEQSGQTSETQQIPIDAVKYHCERFGWNIAGAYSREHNIAFYSGVSGIEVKKYVRADVLNADALILVGGDMGAWDMAAFTGDGIKDVFCVDWSGAIRAFGGVDPRVIDVNLDKHIFNRLGPDGHIYAFDFYYFPYGYLYRDASWGPINAFGHRIEIDLESLKDRDENHVVVACFGGSASWGWGCLGNHIWTSVLERFLNESSKQKFTVLNFAQPSNVLLNEIGHYIMFCNEIKPEYVVSLSGANDLFNAQASDRYLLEEHKITYQQNLEQWSVSIHKSDASKVAFDNTNPKTMLSKNQPLCVVGAYISRVRQFRELSGAVGAKFIWALQPMAFGRKELHWRETEFMKMWNRYGDKEIQNRLPHIYDAVISSVPDDLKECFLDVHTALADLPASEWLYWDVVHPSPCGQEKIGKQIFDYISSGAR